MNSTRSTPELLILQAIRLGGVVNLDAVLDRALMRDDEAEAIISGATTAGWLDRVSFADLSGWVLTSSGTEHLAGVLAEDVSVAGAADVLNATLARFDDVNARFVSRVSTWQLQSTDGTGNSPPDALDVSSLLADLESLGSELRTALVDLIIRLPRFGRYPAQYDHALAKARADGLRWVTGVGLLSCHTVWAELHQDLLSSAGRQRAADPRGDRE